MSFDSFDEDDEVGYAKLSEMYTNFSFSTSGSFEDPSDILSRHPYSDELKRPPLPLPRFSEHNFPELVSPSTQQGRPLSPIALSSFSDSDDETSGTLPIQQSKPRSETRGNIDIIGSLCLQGVMQGLQEENENYETMRRILPDSIKMTANLERHYNAFHEISVMITKNMEIVPETPYNPNVGTKQRSSSTASSAQIYSNLQSPDRPQSVGKIDARPTSVTYFNNIIRPQPLPPIPNTSSVNERKKFMVVESLLESEAAFLTSLNIAIEVYKKPLNETANTELSAEDIKYLFGPIGPLLEIHELFYAALSEETRKWSPEKKIGDIFLASFNKKDVVRHYRKYVINFSKAMSILEKGIKKKPKFYDFLKKQISVSGTALSLQALLLKPISRFPQYMLFLKDLIKYTPATHPDSTLLEMAQADIEGIATYLNETKRRSEQQIIVRHFNSKIEKLPLNLLKTNISHLIRQDVIQWMVFKNGKWASKQRHLFLFSNVLVCCNVKKRKKDRLAKIEVDHVISGEAPRLIFKWFCFLPLLEITKPDYIKDSVPIITAADQEVNTELLQKFEEVQTELKNLDHDFHVLANIAGLLSTLNNSYKMLTADNINNECRILQRKLEAGQELIKSCEPGRVDIIIHSKNDITVRLHQVLLFDSEKTSQEWINDVHLGKLRQNHVNKLTWITDEEAYTEAQIDDDEEIKEYDKHVPKEHLPLVVDCLKLSNHGPDRTTVDCATIVSDSKIWFATVTTDGSYISVVNSFVPCPMLMETFPVSSSKVLCMKSVSSSDSTTVWIGMQCGKLMLFDANTKKCLQGVQFPDSVLCIEKYRNRVFVGTASGHVFVYTRPKGTQWNLQHCNHDIPVSSNSIQCFCAVNDKLWMGIQSSITTIDMSTLKLEHNIKVTSDETKHVAKLERAGTGVWVALNHGATMYLFHKDTRQLIQEIDVKGSLDNIISYADIGNKFDSPLDNLHVTALFALSSYLWIGCSTGAILIYKIPPGLPLLNTRPLLAGDSHRGTVQVIIGLQGKIDNSSTRFDQFVMEEKERMNDFYTQSQEKQLEEYVNNTAKRGPSESKNVTGEPDDGETKGATNNGVDTSVLPPVFKVIQKLELGKLLIQGSPLLTKKRPVPKPRTKKPNQKKPVEPTPPPREGPLEYEVPLAKPNHDVPPKPLEQDESVPLEHDYDSVPLEEQDYDEVPDTDTDLDDDDDDDNDDTQNIPRCQSDAAITPSRYERNTVKLGDSLYEPIPLSSILLDIPGADRDMLDHNSTFIFTGGTGLVNFRPGTDTQLSLAQLNSPGQNTNDFPCIICYQVPF